MSDLNETLREYARRYETPQFLVGDPSWFMHQVSGRDNQETTAFLASALSYGSRQQFLPKIQVLVDMSVGEMHRWISSGAYRDVFSIDDVSCFYRLYNMGTMRRFLDSCNVMLNRYGSIGDYLKSCGVGDAYSAIDALCRWFSVHGSSGVIPRDTSSACKRLCMFLRWMVRDHSPVDLGLWSHFIDKRSLIMPLDTHVLTEACSLGLMRCRTASMSSALKLTERLAAIFPDDPLKGDFALFGYGIDKDAKATRQVRIES